ncbi:MAG: T9SS type A sorting domain-containing protein [Bacteroidetes bacterium]|nr:T9SS type A sorting domain-containing protein [Bacteroidota bacterium]
MPDGSGFAKLLDFTISGTNGNTPYASLISDGTFLYGMTHDGGTNGYGTIFKIMPDGTGFVKLLDFTGANGAAPYVGCSLVSDGTFLYGMTTEGGANWKGNIFKIMPDGTGYFNLLDFTGNANGGSPFGSLISDGTFLYGMTSDDGTFGFGTIFKINACTPSITGNTVLCAGDVTTLTASGGTTYTWSTGSTNASIIVSPVSNTTYTVIATTGTCSATASVTVIVSSQPVISVSNNTTICSGQSTTLCEMCWDLNGNGINDPAEDLNADGNWDELDCVGNGMFYSWSTGATTACIALVPTATTAYNVMVTDANGCTNSDSVTVIVYPAPVLSITSTNATNPTCCDGSATVNVTGGTPNYTYSWSNGCFITSCTGLCSGTYTVTVMDANGCYQTATVTISCPNGIAENNAETDFIISPNPTSGKFNVQMSGFENPPAAWAGVQMNIYNIYGEYIYQHICTSAHPQIDLSSQPSGIYFLHVKTNEGTAVRKIVINK